MSHLYERGLRQSIDWKLLFIYLMLILIGLVNIYASIHSSEPSSIFDPAYRSGKQIIWIGTALCLAGLILFVFNPRMWESISLPLYLFVFVLLVAVIFLGIDVKGSRSWFEFGPVRFQPAEISKITTSLLLATIMSKPDFKIRNLKSLLTVAAVLGIPMLTILAESETGSALVYVGFVFVLYREGLTGWILVMGGVAALIFILTLTSGAFVALLTLIGITLLCNSFTAKKTWMWLLINTSIVIILSFIPDLSKLISEIPGMEDFAQVKSSYILLGFSLASIPFLLYRSLKKANLFLLISIGTFIAGILMISSTEYIFENILQDHQRKRIEVLLGLKEDPSGVGYNVNQSMIAIGSGGLTGKGFLKGTQTTFGFVPEQSTDFIFCTVGEEWGFIGCTIVILLYVMLIWRILHDAENSRESFTRIYGYCVASCIFMHLFINIGMTIGLMPVIGIPLPLLSYGGSSLWTFTILIFIFIALYKAEKKYF